MVLVDLIVRVLIPFIILVIVGHVATFPCLHSSKLLMEHIEHLQFHCKTCRVSSRGPRPKLISPSLCSAFRCLESTMAESSKVKFGFKEIEQTVLCGEFESTRLLTNKEPRR